MLKTDWSYPVDIWNVGAVVCFAYFFLSLIISTNHFGKIGVGFV